MPRMKKKQPGTSSPAASDDEMEFTDADLEQIMGSVGNLVSEQVNAAVTAQLSRKLPGIVAGAMKPIQDQLASLFPGGQPPAGGAQGQPAPGAGQPGGAQGQGQTAPSGGAGQSTELLAMQKQLEDMKKQLADRDAKATQAAQEARNTQRDAMLADHLGKAGVDQNRRRGAVAVLRDGLVYDDNAKAWKYRAQRDGYVEDIDVAAGVKEWAGTDEGKAYVSAPPRPGGAGSHGSAGHGFGAGAGRPPADPKAAKAQQLQAAEQQLQQQVMGLMGGTIQIGGGGGGNGGAG